MIIIDKNAVLTISERVNVLFFFVQFIDIELGANNLSRILIQEFWFKNFDSS